MHAWLFLLAEFLPQSASTYSKHKLGWWWWWLSGSLLTCPLLLCPPLLHVVNTCLHPALSPGTIILIPHVTVHPCRHPAVSCIQ